MTQEAIEYFTLLEKQWRHPRRGPGADQYQFRAANELMFFLAQRIAMEACGPIQQRLDRARAQVVKCIDEQGTGSILLKPQRLRRPVRWCEYMLTPELEGNLALTGARIPFGMARELQEAHRAQVKCVREACDL